MEDRVKVGDSLNARPLVSLRFRSFYRKERWNRRKEVGDHTPNLDKELQEP